MAQFKEGDKVRSKRTGKAYILATFSDMYKHINIRYVREHAEDFEVVTKGGR